MRICDWSSDVCCSYLRDMNPADEFTAFAQLMQRGSVSPADLARQFGFSERYVKQRLRLASLASEILDALREGKLTIDAAMDYAGTQDQRLQLRVFAVEAKKSHEPPTAWNIRFASARKSVVSGKSVSVRVDLGGRRIRNTKQKKILIRQITGNQRCTH